MKEKITIAFLKNRLGPKGGLEKYTHRLLEAFSQKGCETYLLCSNSSGPLLYNQIFFPPAPIPQYLQLQKFDDQVQKWLKKKAPTLIFGMDRTTFQTHLRLGNGIHQAYLFHRKNYEKKLKAWSFQWNPLHKKILELEKKALEHPHLRKVFVNSEMVKQEALHFYSIDPKKIEVVPNGVEWKEMELDFFNWQEEKKKTLEKNKLDLSAYYFLFIGNGFQRKGLVPLLKAFSLLKKKEAYLLVVGKDKNLSFFKKLTHALKIEKKVVFLGEQEKTTPFYQVADCLVIPSFYDPFANVTVEALAMGVPVITSSYNGGKEVFQEIHGHILEDVQDISCFHQALVQAMNFPKTSSQAEKIRNSIKHLDFPLQLEKITQSTLMSV